jgi:hypothetical protein
VYQANQTSDNFGNQVTVNFIYDDVTNICNRVEWVNNCVVPVRFFVLKAVTSEPWVDGVLAPAGQAPITGQLASSGGQNLTNPRRFNVFDDNARPYVGLGTT